MLKFNVTGDKLYLGAPRSSLNSGSKGYYIAEFAFDSDWDGLIPHITITENGTVRADEVIIDNTHKITTTESGVMQIGVYGLDSNGKKCISTNLICIEIKQGAYNGVEPLPRDIWDGYQIIVLGYMERAEAAAKDAIAAEKNINNLSASASEGDTVSVAKTITEEGIKLDFTIPRGAKGDKGERGEQGPQGIQGEKGEPGVPGQDGKPGADGKDGRDGEKGEKGDAGERGEKGESGYTPIRGTDYWTPEDQAEIKGYVDKAILGGAW